MAFAEALAGQPGKLIPELFTRKYDINATYDLLDEREVVPDTIQARHRRLVMAELRTPGRYLLVEDTTFPSYSHREQPVPGNPESLTGPSRHYIEMPERFTVGQALA